MLCPLHSLCLSVCVSERVSVCVYVCLCMYVGDQRLESTQLDQREQMQQLRAEQHRLQQHLDQLTTGQYQPTTGGQLDMVSADSGYQYRVHSSLSESSNASLSSSTGYSSSEHGLYSVLLLLLVISAEVVMFYPARVCLSVCLSVSAASRKNY